MTTYSRLQQAVARAGVRLFIFMVLFLVIEVVASNRNSEFWNHIRLHFPAQVSALNISLVLTVISVWSLSLPPKSDMNARPSLWAAALRFLRFSAILSFTIWGGIEIVDPSYMKAGVRIVSLVLAFELIKALVELRLRIALSGTHPQRAVILGSGRRASKAWREIRLNYRSSVELLGFVDDRNPETMAPDITNRLLCDLTELRNAIIANRIDLMYVAMPMRSCYDRIQSAIDVATSLGVKVLCMEDVYTTTDRQMVLTNELFRDLVPREKRWSAFLVVKRLLDIAGAFLGLIIFLPAGVLIALRIKSSGPGPVFISEDRFGLRGKRFRMFKFRTFPWLGQNAVAAGQFNAAQPNISQQNQSQTTRLGSMLRATSLDELAQFWNVLKGEMSLVGPRPIPMSDVFYASDAQLRERLRVKPGMTGLWQVSGRSTLDSKQSVDIDTRYIKERSLRLDLAILLRTIPAVAKKTGAA